MPDRILEAAEQLRTEARVLRHDVELYEATQSRKNRLLTAAIAGVLVLTVVFPITVWWLVQRDATRTCEAINQNRATIRVVLAAATPDPQTPEEQQRLDTFYKRLGTELDPLHC